MNTKNFAITEYDNFDFNSFCEFEKDTYYACGEDGIYKLGGPTGSYDDDNGTAVDVEIGKEKIDLGVMYEKILREIYINLESDGDMILEISADTKSQTYLLANGYPDLHVLSFSPGKGLRGKFLKVTLKNHRGSDVKINEIEMLIDILSRRAHND